MNLLIKNGRLIDPASNTDAVRDILIVDHFIKDISPHIAPGPDADIIDASGLVVCPGFIDLHVHLRDPGQVHKEDIESGSRAAARGGFTSIACMPNTSPVNDHCEVSRYILDRAKKIGLVNIFPVAAISKNLEGLVLTDMNALVELGVIGFSDDGRCVMNEALFKKALLLAKSLRVPLIEHPEDHNLSKDGQVNDGAISAALGVNGIPAAAEDVIIDRDLRLQEVVNSFLHLTHISTAGAVRSIREAKARGVHVSCDATPHHLLLNESLLIHGDPVFKMKPPLRTESDRLALVEGLQSGVIDCIASDHAPHSRSEKGTPFIIGSPGGGKYGKSQRTDKCAFEGGGATPWAEGPSWAGGAAPFGVIGLETSFPVIYDRLVRPGFIDLYRLIELFSSNPAKILGLDRLGKGVVKPGFPADLTLLDPVRPFKIKAEDFRSKSVNCPFIGWEGQGAVAYTIVNGRIVYNAFGDQEPL